MRRPWAPETGKACRLGRRHTVRHLCVDQQAACGVLHATGVAWAGIGAGSGRVSSSACAEALRQHPHAGAAGDVVDVADAALSGSHGRSIDPSLTPSAGGWLRRGGHPQTRG